ncbi:MAG: hypothetical protein WA188_21155 [Terriglobales bacterium]
MAEETMVREEARRADSPVTQENEREKRERGMDQTLEDSYPASDPPSTIPDPEEDSEAA